LYLTTSENTFDFTQTTAKDGKTMKGVGFAWAPVPGGPTKWTDIKFEIACYKAANGKPTTYDTDDQIKDSTYQTIVTNDSCAGKVYDTVSIRLSQLNNGDSLMNVSKIQATIYPQ
jgi:hypothetical protein